jgi:hypothetical protein
MPIFQADNQLAVSTDGTAGPYIVVTPEQVVPVSKALRAENVGFSIDHDAVMMDGAPALAVINLGNAADVNQVQQILDRVAAIERARQRRAVQGRDGLIVRGNRQAMRELMSRLDVAQAGGWSRKPDIEARLRSTLRSELAGYGFAKHIATINRAVVVLLGVRRAADVDEMYVFGVVPQDSGAPLAPAEHDTVIADVKQSLLQPMVHGLAVRIMIRRVHVGPSIEEALSPGTRELLDEFSAAADRSSLSSTDRDRWVRFIRQTHADGATIDAQMLSTHLEGEGFSAEQTTGLLNEYELGRRLLSDDEG